MRPMADVRRPDSLANSFRRKRFELALALLATVPRPRRILDVGGTDYFWNQMGSPDEGDELVLLNLEAASTSRPNRTGVAGDARDLSQYNDLEFDVVISNSVLEHVGSLEDQRRMAREVRRVGQRYFVQTPHRYFPIEPHFLFPFFQFLPLRLKVALLVHFGVGQFTTPPDRETATQEVTQIRLVSGRELRQLFPDATIYKEKFLGMTKSFVAYGGWRKPS
jgi:methyltransferase family protein